MNDEQKQIEEMAKIIIKAGESYYKMPVDIECANSEAVALYEENYRKQSDTVKEFLKLLKEKESPKLLMWEYGEGYLDCIKMAEELAAKYGVEVKE